MFFQLMTKRALEKHFVTHAYLPKLAGFQELNQKPIHVSVKSPKYFGTHVPKNLTSSRTTQHSPRSWCTCFKMTQSCDFRGLRTNIDVTV